MKTQSMLSLCVYCGSRDGSEAAYANAAAQAGELIGRNGWQLVYGGGRAGLMGRVADSAIAHGAKTVGVIPQSLMQRELGHPGLDELHVVETMHERKRMMAERADAFLALPGGIGTLDELFEAWSWNALGYHAKPFCLLNVDGFWDRMIGFLDHVTESGFMSPARRAQLLIAASPEEALKLLDEAASGATQGMVW